MKYVIVLLIAAAGLLSGNVTAEPYSWKKGLLEMKKRRHQLREKEMTIVQQLHDKIVQTSREATEAQMILYTNTVHVIDRSARWNNRPDVDVQFSSVFVPIKGGEFLMGSPETETGRNADEGPQHRVKVSSFWMQQCEVSWDEYEPFMLWIERVYPPETNYVSDISDAVAKPSKPYVEMSFGMGKHGFPAIGMSQHAANKYCQWLSAKTGHFYRLPTEAEWEYACRAGTTTAYSFGGEVEKVEKYAWFDDNSNDKYQKVGKKKPNPWGLYDMHGNVAEWCLDQYDPAFYLKGKDKLSVDPWNKATRTFPHVLRGGAWNSTYGDASQLRSAARSQSKSEWNTDPSLPKSVWYLDQAQVVGFRMVRPLKIPSAEEMFNCWNSDIENEYYTSHLTDIE